MADRLRHHFHPEVPEFISSKVEPGSIEGYMLEQSSIHSQQLSAIIEVLIDVQTQTTKTNGRVAQHDADFVALNKRLGFLERERQVVLRILMYTAAAITLISPFARALAEYVFPHK